MVKYFVDWLNGNKHKFDEIMLSDFEFDFYNSGESIIAKTENQYYLCQFTIRNDGYINIEVFSEENCELVFYIYFFCKTTLTVNFDHLFGAFFDFMKKPVLNAGNKLITWIKENMHKFDKSGFCNFRSEKKSENKCENTINVQTENNDYICNFIISNNEIIDINVLSKESDDSVFWIRCKAIEGINFDNIFSIFFDFVGNH